MPLVDMPIERLLEYQGRNPKPIDHEAYWTRALASLDQLELAVESRAIETIFPSMKAAEVTYAGIGGARIYAKCAIPTWTSGPHPCLLMFHGYAWKSAEWATLAQWTAAGFAVLAMDVRGQGGKSTDPVPVSGNTLRGHIVRGLDDHPDNLFYRNVFLDCAGLSRVAASLDGIDSDRIYSFGASQGGGLSLACAALSPEIKACVTIYPFLSDYQRVWEMDLAKDAYEELRLFFRIQDPLHQREKEIFEKLGYIDVQHLAPRVAVPTLMMTGQMDTICPPSTQFAAFNKLSGPKEYLLYPDAGHEGLQDSTEYAIRFFASGP